VLQSNFREQGNVVCLNKAVSDHSGIARIYFNNRYKENPQKWSVASTLSIEKPNVDMDNFIECEVVDLAEFIKNLNKPTGLLKMDIEGEEVKVLNKLIDLGLTDKIRNIAVETHERFPYLKGPTKELKKRISREGIKNIDLNWA
jgi:FkbM family methyltransferase